MKETQSRTRGILLDLDGTIVDSRVAYLKAARTAFKAIGLRSPELTTALEIPRRLEQRLPLEPIIGEESSEFLKIYLKTFYESTHQNTKPFSNIKKALAELSRGYKLAIITMRRVPRDSVVHELEHFGLARYFTYVATAFDTVNPKPSPKSLIKAIKVLNVELCNCMVVGDSVTDISAGKAAGIATVGVLSGLFSREELSREKPDLILNSVVELFGKLKA